jgi:hypothetical protein
MAMRAHILLAATTFAVLLAGCGGTATPTAVPTPVPTAAPAPTPSPTPDPAALAVAAFAARDMRAHADLVGTVEAGGTTLDAAGTMDLIGDSEHETYETKVGTEVLEAKEVISVGGDEWERLGDGPWHPSDGTDTAMVTDLADLTELVVVGEETLDGEAVIHVRPGPGVTLDPRGWGPGDPAATGWTSEALDLWIKPDGTLVKLDMTEAWQQPSGDGTIPVAQHTVATFSPLAASVTIEAPADAWVAHTSSEQGYTISQPAGYEVVTDQGTDRFMYGDEVAVAVVSGEAGSASGSIDEVVQALAAGYAEQMGAELLLTAQPPAGHTDARIAVFKVMDEQGTDLRLVDAIMVEDGRLWEVYRIGTPDTAADDVLYVGNSLTTLEIAPGS